ncbi:MAG: RiPP maturation radical SAM C-methyltransferase [Acidobacteriaceae bacterium]
MAKVALVQMPYGSAAMPSLGLGLLKAALVRRSIATDVHYLNFGFRDLVGAETYAYIAANAPSDTAMLGEWSFHHALRDEAAVADEGYFETVFEYENLHLSDGLSERAQAEAREHAWRCAREARAYLERCLDAVAWDKYRIVGFTSVFQQHLPSLAMARLLKQRYPELLIVLGGANCEGVMGKATLQSFPFVDAVCSGEGDDALPLFAEAVLAGKPSKVQGMLMRDATPGTLHVVTEKVEETPRVEDMDGLPYPDFDDFFAVRSEEQRNPEELRLTFETSRGCWWGEKHHCTFCGLNGNGMRFRHKSASRALEELQWLVERYGKHTQSVHATDNILPYEYFGSFLPELAKLGLDIDLFFETKANLKDEQIQLYRRAGLRQVQPGIESLNSEVLTLMDKGVTAIQNIQLLKMCHEYGVQPLWNYLYGFPGERLEWYREQPQLIEMLYHFEPPVHCERVRFDRFSRYVEEPGAFGLREMKPYPAYELLYRGLPQERIGDLAYFFMARFEGDEAIRSYATPIIDAVRGWQASKSRASLLLAEGEEATVVFDSRGSSGFRVIPLAGIQREMMRMSRRIVSRSEVKRRLGEMDADWGTDETVGTAVEELQAMRLLICEGEKMLGLPVSAAAGVV